MTGGKMHPLIKCHHITGDDENKSPCKGDLIFSHEVSGRNKMSVYICTDCGGRTDLS